MSVVAIGTTIPRMGPTNSANSSPPKMTDARSNTGQTGMYTNIFRGSGGPQKLPMSRIPDIVQRMQQDTKSSSAKKGQWYKSDSYIDPRTYSWKNLALFGDYQAQMWTKGGGIKSTFKK